MTRRRFLQVVACCGVTAAAVGSVVWRKRLTALYSRGMRPFVALLRTPEQRLHDHFSYLDLDPAGVAQYFVDYERYRAPFHRRSPLPPDACMRYLLSTDFFRHDANASRQIRYVGFYDPDVTPCNNPLARFDA
jgi:hypothetical protein